MGCLAGEVHLPEVVERMLVPRGDHFSKNNGSPELLSYLATKLPEAFIGGVKYLKAGNLMVSTRLTEKDFLTGRALKFPGATHVKTKNGTISLGLDGRWTLQPWDEKGRRFAHEGDLPEFEWLPVGTLVACHEKDKFPRYGFEFRMERTVDGWKRLDEWFE